MGTNKLNNKLTDKQALFCREYLVDLNATQAAIRAKYSKKTAGQIGERLLKKVEIQEVISILQAKRAEKIDITAERVLRELANIAFSDIRKFYDEEGKLKHPKDLNDQAAAALSSIDVDELNEYYEGQKNSIGETKKIKLWDKLSALEKIAKHIGLFEKDNEQSKPVLIHPPITVYANGTPPLAGSENDVESEGK